MAMSNFRVLRREGRVVLVETANPDAGVGYSVRIGTMGFWNGDSRAEADRKFDEAAKLAKS